MTIIRSVLFNTYFLFFHLFLVVGMLVLLPFPRSWMQRTVRLWTNVLGAGLKLIVGLDIEVRGFENLPQGAAVIACKHLSAWDTFVFYRLARDPNYILKKELMEMPVWGWHARKCGAISGDRDGGAAATGDAPPSLVPSTWTRRWRSPPGIAASSSAPARAIPWW